MNYLLPFRSAFPCMAACGAAVVVALLLVGCQEEARVSEPVPYYLDESVVQLFGDGLAPNRPAEPPADAPLFQLTAREFYDAYQADEEATIEKYRGAWVELSGEVDEIGAGANDFGGYLLYIRLVADPDPDKPAPFVNTDFINCYVREPEPWKKVAVGGRVTLRGTLAHRSPYRGYFDHCTVVDAEGGPTLTLTAAELARRYLADPAEARETLHERPVVVAGAVAVNRADDSLFIYDVRTLLQGEGETLIALHYTLFEERQFKQLKPGDRVLVAGKLHVAKPDQEDDEDEKHRVGITFASRLDLAE